MPSNHEPEYPVSPAFSDKLNRNKKRLQFDARNPKDDPSIAEHEGLGNSLSAFFRRFGLPIEEPQENTPKDQENIPKGPEDTA